MSVDCRSSAPTMDDLPDPPGHIYDGMVMHGYFPASILDRIKKMQFHDSDVVIATYPKCGTTWMQEILFLIHTDGDIDASDKIPIHERYPFIERCDPTKDSDLDVYLSKSPPQLVKTHLPAYFFEETLKNKTTKFIVVFRNPKDMLVSYYHFYKMAGFDYEGTWDEYFDLFKSKKLCHGDYFGWQLCWWKWKDHPNALILNYEDMLKSPEGAIKQVATHVGKTISDDLVAIIAARTSFKSMKQNPMLNYSTLDSMKQDVSPFMRKGTVGDWRNYFSETQTEYVDQMSEKHFKPVGLFMQDYLLGTEDSINSLAIWTFHL